MASQAMKLEKSKRLLGSECHRINENQEQNYFQE
jgi:hypothetical protein